MKAAVKRTLTLAQEIAARKERDRREKAIYARGYRRGQNNARHWHQTAVTHLQEQLRQKTLELDSLRAMTDRAAGELLHWRAQVAHWRAKAGEFANAHDAQQTPDLVTPPVVDETHG